MATRKWDIDAAKYILDKYRQQEEGIEFSISSVHYAATQLEAALDQALAELSKKSEKLKRAIECLREYASEEGCGNKTRYFAQSVLAEIQCEGK